MDKEENEDAAKDNWHQEYEPDGEESGDGCREEDGTEDKGLGGRGEEENDDEMLDLG